MDTCFFLGSQWLRDKESKEGGQKIKRESFSTGREAEPATAPTLQVELLCVIQEGAMSGP